MTSKRILVVDDNATNLKLFTFLLASPAHDVRTATNAREALAVLEAFLPDLILMDIQLPDIDGLELTRQLRRSPRTCDTTIVAVTAYAMKGDAERARAAGVDGYISKPIEKQAFRQAVAEYLGAAKRGCVVNHSAADQSLPARCIVEMYEARQVSEHPFFHELKTRPVDLQAIWVLMANLRAGISNDFVRWLATTIARIDDRRIACIIAKQLDDELGKGDVTRIHSILLDHFMAGLDRWRPKRADESTLAAGQRMAQRSAALFHAPDPYEGVGALIAGEIFAKKMDHCLGDEIRRQDGIPSKALTWLVLHETLEVDHADDSLDLAVLIPDHGPALTAAWRGATTEWNVLWEFLDDVRQIASAQ
jgi:CheY-like chemotaxis protein/pyrroloquinoline quinone (PQQ) biosynthesis protein C